MQLHLLQSQQTRLSAYGVSHVVDIHCHCLPGLDDGPGTMDQAVALCRALAGDGVTSVIATPHQLGRYDLINSASRIREAITELRDALASAQIPLSVWPGGDVRIDERILELIDRDQVLTLADAGRYVLLELPHDILVDPVPLIAMLSAAELMPLG